MCSQLCFVSTCIDCWHVIVLQEMKKKELDELNALLGELGIDTAAEEGAAGEGKKKKKKDKKKGEGENGTTEQPQQQAATSSAPAAAEPEGQEDEQPGEVVDPAVVSDSRCSLNCRCCHSTLVKVCCLGVGLAGVSWHCLGLLHTRCSHQGPAWYTLVSVSTWGGQCKAGSQACP